MCRCSEDVLRKISKDVHPKISKDVLPNILILFIPPPSSASEWSVSRTKLAPKERRSRAVPSWRIMARAPVVGQTHGNWSPGSTYRSDYECQTMQCDGRPYCVAFAPHIIYFNVKDCYEFIDFGSGYTKRRKIGSYLFRYWWKYIIWRILFSYSGHYKFSSLSQIEKFILGQIQDNIIMYQNTFVVSWSRII